MSHHDDHNNHHDNHGSGHGHGQQPKKKKSFKNRVKGVPARVTKYLTERDTMFATVWVFIFIFALGSIPLNLKVLNPIKESLKDFDFNDKTYSDLSKAKNRNADYTIDDRIVIVNMGYANRAEIAMIINKIAVGQPKVIGLDALFNEPRDSIQDAILTETFANTKELVAARMLVLSGKQGDTVAGTGGDYIKGAPQYAHVNLWADSLSTVRYCYPIFEDHAHKQYLSFAAAMVKAYDTAAFKKLEKKSDNNSKLIINYSRRIDRYQLIQYEQLLNDEVDSLTFKDKIVLIGYINEDPNNLEDKKFTPMNARSVGKTIPDMNGIVVHANIISMALDKTYVKKVPLWGNLLLAVIVCWLHMSFFVHYYLEAHIWFHLAAKIAQVASVIFFAWLGIYLYERYRLKVDTKMSILTIALAVDVIYFYEAWAVWMHKKFNYKTVFKPHHH